MTWQVEQLKKSYKGKDAISGISINFERGTATGLLGANGAGKSTLIKCILGLIIPSSGSIHRDGVEMTVGYLPENPSLPETVSALHLVEHMLRIRNHSAETARQLLEEAGLKEEFWKKPLRTYSKGMRQRAALACALAANPPWLILDEPMSGLDALGRKHVLSLLEKRLKEQNVGILVCSHAVTDLVRLCSNVLLMANSEVKECVPISDHSMQEVALLEEKLAAHNQSYTEKSHE